MAKEKFDRSKPHVNIGQIGNIDHSKTTLTAALTKTLAKQQQGEYDKIDQKEDTPKEDQKGITINDKTHKD